MTIVVLPETPPPPPQQPTIEREDEDHESDNAETNDEFSEPLPRKSTTSTVELEVLDDEPRSILLALVSQLTVGMDLHKVTLPTFVLETRSMCERITDFMSHPDLIIGIPLMTDPVERFIGITRFFLSGWHIQPKGVKKPYNPVLGEFFRCTWKLPDSSTSYYICEQVSHHPPISTYAYINPHHQFHISGDLRPKSRFLGNSAATLMHGSTRIKLKPKGGNEFEEYTISFPNMYARGILFGTMYTELGDSATITCEETDLSVTLEFKTRGVFSDRTLNVVEGTVKRRTGGQAVAAVSGKWSDELFIERLDTAVTTGKRSVSPQGLTPSNGGVAVGRSSMSSTGSIRPSEEVSSFFPSAPRSVYSAFQGIFGGVQPTSPSSASSSTTSLSPTTPIAITTKKLLFDANHAETCLKQVPAEAEMEPFESRKLWKSVTRGIQTKNLDEATAEKTAIEENQRKICKLRDEQGVEWKHRFFVVDGDVWKLDIEELVWF
ncbi:UNVERIFIED_CONTAM: hypothetical protein HDU68_004746 [Siphonaria sp. JEL0065]|nr:hypothetical protein HDU68_004746 [Siphonaria sp. JEL0065]